MRRRQLLLAGLRRVGRVLAYLGCVGFACGFLAAGLRLDRIDLALPMLDSGDALLILPMIQAQHEGGTHWVNDRLGAPGRQELYDFPVIDHWHFACVALIDRAVGHPVVAFNVYYLLTYPLAAVCAMFAGRCLGLSLPAAGCLGLLYAFLPYHQMRGLSHYFLSAYYLVPLALVVVVNLSLGRVRLRRAGWPVLAALVTSCAGAYYAFFICTLLAVAALYGAALRRSFKPLGWGGLLVGVVVAGGVANHAPTYLYQRDFGRNTAPVARQPEDSEWYAMKLTYLVLPIPNHRVPALARWRSAHDSISRPIQTDANAAMLGVVGVAGLLVAVVAVVRPRSRRRRVVRAVSVLVAGSFLIATVGGVGALFSDLINPSVRGLARMSVVLAFLALWLAVVALDRGQSRRWYVRWPLFAGVTVLGLSDTTPKDWGRSSRIEYRTHLKERYADDRTFYQDIETHLDGGTVFQLPFNDYPEGVLQRGTAMGSYDHARVTLHTTRTRWSFGAMKGREVDQWQREVATAEVPEMLRRLVLRGFDGLLIDSRSYEPSAASALEAAVMKGLRVKSPSLLHGRGEQSFYDLRPYRERLKADLGERYGELARAEVEEVRVLWFDGFASFEPLGREDAHRWCARRGEAWLVNPSDRTKRVTMTMVARTESVLPTTLSVTGDTWCEAIPIDAASGSHAVTVEVPPGRHRVGFACPPPRDWVPRDARRHVFFLAQFRLTRDE
jgi:hypothetical protein